MCGAISAAPSHEIALGGFGNVPHQFRRRFQIPIRVRNVAVAEVG